MSTSIRDTNIMERFKCPISVFLILKKNNKLYLQLRKNCSFSGMYGLIGGHVDGQEKLKTAIIREAKEEAGIILDEQSLKLVTICHSNAGGVEYLQFFFKCDKWSGEVENMEPERCEEIKLFEQDNLPENIVPYIQTALSHVEKQIIFFEDGF